MRPVVWLASYPKSGNTWLRVLIGALSVEAGGSLDINALRSSFGIASGRERFDNLLMVDSGLLTHDEIDRMRPLVYRTVARDERSDADDDPSPGQIRFVKVHDAYTTLDDGTPLLAGAQGAAGTILVVRDPRAVAPSLANHMRISIDKAIDFMANPRATFSGVLDQQPLQLRQKLLDWSGHIESWLTQSDVPVHLLRYEDLAAGTAERFGRAMAFAGLSLSEQQIARAVDLASFARLQEQERATGFSEWNDRGGARLFFRRGEAQSWRAELSAGQIARIESAHAPMMRRLGYEPSPP